MRMIVDLDGTISPLKEDGQSYADLVPRPGAVEKLKEFKEQGHYIIISTARNMATQEANLGKVLKNVGLVTLQWLEKYEIPYDEIYFGKPNGEIYIDDRAFRFNNWGDITEESLKQLARPK